MSTVIPAAVAGVKRAESAADRAERAAAKARQDSDKSRGVAQDIGAPKTPVNLPGKMWSERQRESIGEFLEFLPLIEIVAALPPAPNAIDRAAMQDDAIAVLMNSRLTALLAAKKIVIERVRKET